MKLRKFIRHFKDEFVYAPVMRVLRHSSKQTQELICSDIEEMNKRNDKHEDLIYWFKNYPQYRNLFYFRVGSCANKLKKRFPEYPLFFIRVKDGIGKNAYVLNHPYGTILNAQKIGDNFTCCHLTTIGNKRHGENDKLPTIGNNVSLGANVTILGAISLGNNVLVGGGSVVVKDVPDNCIVGGNPAKIIR